MAQKKGRACASALHGISHVLVRSAEDQAVRARGSGLRLCLGQDMCDADLRAPSVQQQCHWNDHQPKVPASTRDEGISFLARNRSKAKREEKKGKKLVDLTVPMSYVGTRPKLSRAVSTIHGSTMTRVTGTMTRSQRTSTMTSLWHAPCACSLRSGGKKTKNRGE